MARPLGKKDARARTRRWTDRQNDLLTEKYYQMTDQELSLLLNKSVRQLRKHARELGLKPKISIRTGKCLN